jgi:hypothetical protein
MICVWCERELPYPATIPYIAIDNKAICMQCVSYLNLIVVDQEKLGRLTPVRPEENMTETEDRVAEVLENTLLGFEGKCEGMNLIEVLYSIGQAITFGAKHLGNNDAATPMGALEAHGKCILDASDRIAGAISDLADAIREINEARA